MTRRATLALLALLPLLAGCVDELARLADTGASTLAVGDELVIADSLTGERCAVRKTGDDGTRLRIETMTVLCDGWQSPAGRLERFPLPADEPLAPFIEQAALRPFAPGEASCEPSQAATMAGGGEAVLRACTTIEGWPAMAFALRADIEGTPGVITGFGLPQLMPVLETLAEAPGEARLRVGGTRSAMVELARIAARQGGREVGLATILDHRDLVRLAMAYNAAGEFAAAIEARRRALGLQRRARGQDGPFMATGYAALALNLASDGQAREADAMFERADALAKAVAWSDAHATLLGYRAAFEADRGRPEAALELVDQAISERLARQGDRSTALARLRGTRAGILARLGRLDEAARQAETALGVFRRAGDYPGMAFAHGRLAAIRRERGDLAAAEDHVRAALRLSRLLFGDSPNLALLAHEQGMIALAAGREADALEAFGQMATIAGDLRRKETYLRGALFEPYLDLLIRRGETGRAFVVAQLPRSPVIDKAARQMTAALAGQDPALRARVRELGALRERAAALRLELGERELSLAPAVWLGDAERLRLQGELDAATAAIADHERALQADFPRYGALVQPPLVTPGDIASVLGKGEAVLRVLTTDHASYVFWIGGDGATLAARRDIGREALTARVAGLRRALTFEGGLRPFDSMAAHALFEDLLGPFAARLEDASELVAIVDGPLLSLPLALLPTEAPSGGTGYADIAWLGRKVAVSSAAGPASFVAMRRELTPSKARRAFLGIGDPLLGGQGVSRQAVMSAAETCREAGPFDPLVLASLPGLPETADELRLLAGALGSDGSRLQLGAEAREAAVRGADLADFRVISFATHGLLPTDLPCFNQPALVLSPPAMPSAEEDGLLDASEIATLDLDADWVVLSACNTAGPDGRLAGEALSGIASAFLEAGARSLLVSHWDVASNATVTLMQRVFEDYGAHGGDRARSLQRAQAAMMDDPAYAHPAFWAAFALVGESGGAAGS